MIEKFNKIELGTVCKLKGGFAFKSFDFQIEGIPLVKISNIQNNKTVKSNGDVFINEKFLNSHKNFILRENDVVIAMSGATTGKIGKVNSLFSPSFLNQRVGQFQAIDNSKIDIELIYQIFSQKSLIDFILSNAGSSAQPNISPSFIEKIKIILPENKQEQTRIAEILSTADETISETEALIAKYQRIKTGLMQDLLTKGIDQNGNIRNKKTHKFVVKNGIEVPEGWEVGTLEDIATINPPKAICNDKNTIVSFIAMEDVSNDGKLLNLQERNYLQVKSGFTSFKNNDIIFAKITPCMENGKGAYLSNLKNGIGFGSTEFHVFRPKNIKSTFFIYHLSIFKEYRIKAEASMSGSAGQQRVQREFFEKYKILLPTLNEQEKIATILNGQDELIDNEKTKLSKLQKLKTGLMQDLLSGKVRVKV